MLPRAGTSVAPVSPVRKNYLEVCEMTRTFGAALGVVIVLLFFASLTVEQNRVVAVARAAAVPQK
jgi:hypothetical protein